MTIEGIIASLGLMISMLGFFDIIHWIDEGYSFIYHILIKGGLSKEELKKINIKEKIQRERGDLFESQKQKRGAIFVTISSILMIIVVLKIAHII